MDPVALQQRVRTIAEPIAIALGYELVAVEWLGRTLRLSIDGPNGISADDCARYSEYVSPALDEADPIVGAWHLEVSSPGIDRPLQRAADFQRFTGYKARLRLADRRRVTGRLGGMVDDDIKIQPEKGEALVVPRTSLLSAHLVLTLEEYVNLREVPGDQ